jgi:hypothetical protein
MIFLTQVPLGRRVQRINGRIAMIAFAGAAAAEVATGKSVLEQATVAPVFVTFMVFLIVLGSLLPKYAAGVSLARLLEATGQGSFFLWPNIHAHGEISVGGLPRKMCVTFMTF